MPLVLGPLGLVPPGRVPRCVTAQPSCLSVFPEASYVPAGKSMLSVLGPPLRQHLPYVTNKNCNDRVRVSWEFREVQPDHTARDLSDVLAWVRRGTCETEECKDGYCRECDGLLFTG